MHSWVGDKQQRAAYEKQLTEVALKASQEKERLRELVRWEAVMSLLFAASHRQECGDGHVTRWNPRSKNSNAASRSSKSSRRHKPPGFVCV